MSKRWRRRFRRIGKTAVKVGIAVVGVALSGITGGASVALAGAALAALAKRDQMAAAKARARAQEKIAQGQDPAAALLAAIMEGAPPADIRAQIEAGTKQPLSGSNVSDAIRAQLGTGPGLFSLVGPSPDAKAPEVPPALVPTPRMFAMLRGA